ncbi:MAG: transcription antitermination factor NusB [Actinomycetota bacterium]
MNPRHAERRRALDALYQADVMGVPPPQVLEEWRAATGEEVPAFTAELVRGVEDQGEDLDLIIGEAAEGWTIERMAVVDRTILRLACYELLYGRETPVAVAIAEAVEAANELSTDDSGRFVNGVLGKVARERRTEDGVADEDEAEAGEA